MVEMESDLKINNKPLRERIADILRHSIVIGDLKPGDTIVEATLAEELGVSRAPLREALQILHTENLVEVIPYHRTTVRKLTRQDIEELYSLRSVLEQFAIRRIITENRHGDIEPLHVCYEAMLAAAEQGDAAQTSSCDHQFHDTLVMLSQHSLLISTWNAVSQRVRQVLALRDMRREDIQTMAKSHEPILEAIEAGDIALATARIDAHILTASEFIVGIWQDKDDN